MTNSDADPPTSTWNPLRSRATGSGRYFGFSHFPIGRYFTAGLTLSLLLTACRNEISEIRAITDPQNLPVQTNINARYTLTEKGKKRNILIAKTLHRFAGEENYLEARDGFRVVFYDSLGREEARLEAINGRYDENLSKLVAWDQVVLTNASGEKLETEELIFVQDSARIYSEKFVTITTQSGVINGTGLESNDSFTRYRIIKPSGNLYVSEETDNTLHGKNP